MNILILLLLVVLAFEVVFSIFGIYILVQEKSIAEKDIKNLDESTKEYKDKIFPYLMLKDIVVKGFIQNIPSIIGGGILLFSLSNYSGVIRSIGFFIVGFNGVFRMAFRSIYIPDKYYFAGRKVFGNVLFTLFMWGFAIYSLTGN